MDSLTAIFLMDNTIAFFLTVVALPVMTITSIPVLLIWTHHRRKIEEIRLRGRNAVSENIRAEFVAVRAEIQALRDTSTQYDISFDTSLQRLERRIEQIECQPRPQVSPPTPQNPRYGADDDQNRLYGGRS